MNLDRALFSRRSLLCHGVGLAFVGLVASCGDDDDTSAPTSPSVADTQAATPNSAPPETTPATTPDTTPETSPKPTESSAPEATTKTVDTIHGPVEVPTKPQRVLCLGFVDTACMLDIGVVPIGMSTSGVNFLPEYADLMSSIPEVTNEATFEYEIELIASLQPDLIIGSDWLDAAQQAIPFDQLSQIAPTAICEWQQSAGNWPEQAAWFADVVGRSAELQALEADYDARADEVKAQHEAVLDRQWVLVQGGLGEWYFYTARSSHGQVFTRAGVQLADVYPDETGGYVALSNERIGDLAVADVIGLNTNVSAQEGADELRAQPLYQTLPAVTAGDVYPMTWFFPSSYKVAMALLDEIDTALTALA